MGLAPTLTEEMDHVASGHREGIRDHPAMAAPPKRLGAHDGGGRVARCVDEPGKGGAEPLGLHVVGVAPEGIVSKRDVRRVDSGPAEAAELFPPHVLDGLSLERGRQGIPAELRMAARARRGADVDQSPDPSRTQDCQELLDRPRAVPHGEDHRKLLARLVRRRREVPSSSGRGHHPLKVETRVQIPLGLPRSHTTKGQTGRSTIPRLSRVS